MVSVETTNSEAYLLITNNVAVFLGLFNVLCCFSTAPPVTLNPNAKTTTAYDGDGISRTHQSRGKKRSFN
jgi:hypothetical protein